MSTRFFLTNTHPASSAPSRSTTSTSQVNASPRFVKSPIPVLDSELESDAESLASNQDDKKHPKSPNSILSQDMSSDDMSFGVMSLSQSMLMPEEQHSGRPGPQLVMPTVHLPSKRPFTENGMKLGNLKILVAGDSGVGKSALIQAIAKINQDIVHVDEPNCCKDGLWEVHASTKPYPLFWLNDQKQEDVSMSDERPSPGRRPSMVHSASSAKSDESALDRNLCFVDSIGYGDGEVDSVVGYLEDKFKETAELVNASSPQVLALLTSTLSSELPHVDVCFYMVLNRLKQADLDYMAKVNKMCPIIPVVAKSDTIPDDDQVLDLKVDILKQMASHGIEPFLFDTSVKDAIRCGEMLQAHPRESAPNGGDAEDGTLLHPLLFPCTASSMESQTEMVASVLMSPEYVPGLVESELSKLCSYVFSEQGSAWLRYTAAKRFIQWNISYHVSNTLVNGLAIRNTDAALVKVSSPTAASDEYIINLPSSAFALNNHGKAQQYTARWAMQLEQAARSDNAFALRARCRRRSANSDNDGRQNKKRPQMPRSVLNLDPLGLKGLSYRALKYIVRALGVMLGIKIVAVIYSKSVVMLNEAASPSQPIPQPPRQPALFKVVESLGWPFLRT